MNGALILFIALSLSGCASFRKAPPPSAVRVPADSAAAPGPSTEMAELSAQSDTALEHLSGATRLLLQAINNYVEVLPNHKRTPEVLLLKGHTFYNNKMYEKARDSYQELLKGYGKSLEVPEAIKMTAQTYYEEQKFDNASEWYKKLQAVAQSGEDKNEAEVRLAEAYFQIGEKHQQRKEFAQAREAFEQVAIEFPSAKIADAALYNVGTLYEEEKAWSQAILTFNKLLAAYSTSPFVEKALFRTAKDYENIGNWSKAAITYIEVVNRFSTSTFVKEALYNAGLAYEKEGNMVLAAKAYEKYAKTWPGEADAPDVLFKAGELYGKLEDWENVEIINRLFGERYGKDKNRIVMALCMTGVASYMQKKYPVALTEFEQTLRTGRELGFENKINAFYAAKAQYTIGEIKQKMAEDIALRLPETQYRKLMQSKIRFTEEAVAAFTGVSEFKLIDWTTKSIYKIGETFEQFGVAMFNRERPQNLSLLNLLSLEEGIAKVVEDYFVGKALSAHEQNVAFGIEYKYEDEWTKKSRQQLTKLPCLAAANYSKLVEISGAAAEGPYGDDPMKIIQKKLENLQNIAPFQDKAIALYLKTLEMGAKYGTEDKYRTQAAGEITRMSYDVGNTYAEVVTVARGAPIPSAYDGYKRFFYKVNLLSEGLVQYEQSAISALFKNIKIAEAYGIKDEWVGKSRDKIAEVLFTKALCYEILATEALHTPPAPQSATEEEMEEYRVQFEDLGFKLQDEAYNLHRDILEKGRQGTTSGPFLDMTYLRLYHLFPKEVGVKVERETTVVVAGGKGWKVSPPGLALWEKPEFNDSAWVPAKKGFKPDSVSLLGFSEVPQAMWGGADSAGKFHHFDEVLMRRTFALHKIPKRINLEFSAAGQYEIFVNGTLLPGDSIEASRAWYRCRKRDDFFSFLKPGENVLAVRVKARDAGARGLFLNFTYTDVVEEIRPQVPSQGVPIPAKELAGMKVEYPKIPNFDYTREMFQ